MPQIVCREARWKQGKELGSNCNNSVIKMKGLKWEKQ